jgi:hypothetical protein
VKIPTFVSGISIRDGILGLAILALLSGFLFRGCQLDRARDDARGNALRVDSLEAVNDSTRDMNDKAKKILADSMLKGVERRAVQAEIQRDRLDKALGRVTQALASVQYSLRALEANGQTSPVVDSGDLRTATFEVDSTPYHATAKVALPPAPAPGKFSLEVKIDSARVGVRIQCGKASSTGIRPATVGVTTPPWLDARIENPIFDPEVCNPEKQKGWRWPWWTTPAGLVVGGLAGMAVSR